MSQFYEIDSAKISLQERWWWSRSPMVVVTYLLSLSRVRTPCSSDDLNTESTLPFQVASLPEQISAKFGPLTAELEGLGFYDPVYHVIEDVGTRATVFWATFRHESGLHVARIHHRRWERAPQPDRGMFPLFFTEFADGTFTLSSAGKPDMAAPQAVRMNRMFQSSVASLWKKHLELVETRATHPGIRPMQTAEDLLESSERLHVLVRDFHLARGVFRVRTSAEQAQVDQFSQTLAEVRATGVENADVIAELEKLQQQTTNWKNGLWMLLGSAVLFIAAGSARGSWKFTLWLIPALLLHEAGHWVAMRLFKYRNLRMFFIPLFGAAVSGQHWNVPGWKKALVSLAGPLPGIVLGAGLGVLAMLLKKPFLNQAALTLLILNGFNLLPILPLDGGHVLQAILFCRNRWLDFAFRVAAILGLVGLSLAGAGRFLIYIAIPMAIALPVAFALGKAIDTLRRTPPPPPAPGEDRIPAETAQIIITEIRKVLPKGAGAGILARQTLDVFENLNAKPPGVLVTALLLAMHGAGIFFVIIFGALLIVSKQGALGPLLGAAARQPKHTLQCESLRVQASAEMADSNLGQRTTLLVATLKNHLTASKAFDLSAAELPAQAKLTLFGDSLMLALPAQDDAIREQWFDRLQKFDTNTFVAVSNSPVSFSLTFLAPTAEAAEKIEKELNEYFDSALGMHLIPPWSPDAHKPSFDSFRNARRAWKRIEYATSRVFTNAEVRAYNDKITAASRRGSAAEAARLGVTQKKTIEKLQASELDSLAQFPELAQYGQLIDFERQLNQLDITNRVARREVLKQVASQLGSISTDAGHAPVFFGTIVRHGLMLEAPWWNIPDSDRQLPELARWLCSQGCTGMHYSFLGSLSSSEDDPDEQ